MTLASRINDLAGAVRDKINLMVPRLLPAGGTTGQVLRKVSGTDYNATWQDPPSGSGSSATYGTVQIDFGANPGTTIAEKVITGQSSIASTAKIKVWIQADDSDDYNAYEHSMILASRLGLSAGNIVDGVGFTIYAETELRLTGNVAVRWEWSN